MAENLDQETPSGAPIANPAATLPAPEVKESPDETTRKYVAYALLVILTAIVVAAFSELFIINGSAPGNVTDDNAADSARLMSLMNVIFGPIVTLFSSVVGFYFGARTAKEAARP